MTSRLVLAIASATCVVLGVGRSAVADSHDLDPSHHDTVPHDPPHHDLVPHHLDPNDSSHHDAVPHDPPTMIRTHMIRIITLVNPTYRLRLYTWSTGATCFF